MIRKIIQIDEEKCNGCGLCAKACHEGAIGMQAGKAKLLRDDYCDGLGNCLPACPAGAITFVEREAAAYDEAAVLENKNQLQQAGKVAFCACSGNQPERLQREDNSPDSPTRTPPFSKLQQWPVQIKLAPIQAPYFKGAHLLIAADCSAYAYGNFHQDFIQGKITLIGCPKLDEGDYKEKLVEIICRNEIAGLTLVRMEVPCCGGIEHAAAAAVADSRKQIPFRVVTISTDGRLLDL